MIQVNGYEITRNFFPDQTYRIELSHDCVKSMARNKSAVLINWQWEDTTEYMMLYFIVQHLRDKCGQEKINLSMPYIPDARMDRTENPAIEVFTLKYFAKFINDLHFNKVFVMDPHSNVSLALLERCHMMDCTDFVKRAFEMSKADLLYFPDAGAMKRYSKDYNWAPFLYGQKDRNWTTGKINGVTVCNPIGLTKEKIEGKTILIVDDICSKGGTFYHSGIALKELGVGSIDLYVTHCEQSIFYGKLFTAESPIRHVYTTDSLLHAEHTNMTTMKIY